MILHVKKVNFAIQKQKIIVLLVLILIPSFINAFWCPEIFADYSYGGIISHEIDGNHTHQQRISSYSGGVGITYGISSKIIVLGLTYMYWKSDNYLYALDYNNNPVPIAKKMRRHYVRPYIGVQIDQ